MDFTTWKTSAHNEEINLINLFVNIWQRIHHCDSQKANYLKWAFVEKKYICIIYMYIYIYIFFLLPSSMSQKILTKRCNWYWAPTTQIKKHFEIPEELHVEKGGGAGTSSLADKKS